MNKICTKCKESKPLSEFGKSKNTKDNLTYWCLQCKRDYARSRKFDPVYIYQQIRSRVRFCRKNNKGYRSGGKRVMSITQDEFVVWYVSQDRECIYCELPEEDLHKYGDLYNDKIDRLTVDCADNDMGYAKSNLVLSCGRCNSIKSDFLSFEEMIYVGRNMVAKRWE